METHTIVQYQTDFGTIGEGYVVEVAESPLTGKKLYRVVDFLSEIDDDEAGKWRDAADCWAPLECRHRSCH